MRVKPAILFLISLSLIVPQKIEAEPFTLSALACGAIGGAVGLLCGVVHRKIRERAQADLPTVPNNEPDEITVRKRECAKYREAIKEFEKTLQENANTKNFYSYTLLAPVSYVRNVAGYDEKLRASNGQALREIYHFRELLREGYCTGVEKK